MKTRWMVAAKRADFKALGEELNIDPVVVRVMRNRGLETAGKMRTFLDKDAGVEHDPYLLPDMERAVGIIFKKLKTGKSIRIIGDYDVDGVTSVCILYKGLRALGAEVSYAIPNRVTDGYGINESMIDKAFEDGIDTIITCDNGIAAADAIDKAIKYGMTCIVTDHHEVPYTEKDGIREYILPKADAVIDPKLEGCVYPYPGICGAMVAYKLIRAVFDVYDADDMSVTQEAVKKDGSYKQTEEHTEDERLAGLLAELKELAGIATVCDVMELTDENRYVVSYTLESLKNSRNVGVRALRRVCGTEGKLPNVHELGFIIGPCLNATGRLDSADRSVELLLAEDERDAVVTASELKGLNDLRKGYTEEGEKAALEYIADNGMEDEKVLILYLPKLHESLAGIVAGRIKERFYRPTIVFTDSEDGIKGSGRSIETYDMYEELNRHRELYTRFGGHKMAAGLSMDRENLKVFIERICRDCTLTEDELEKKITIDVPMPLAYVTEELIRQLGRLEPYGTGNPKPLFADKDLSIISVTPMGKTGDMCRIKASDRTGRAYELVMFKGYKELILDAKSIRGLCDPTGLMLDAVYYPDINEYNGRRTVQFIVQEYRLS